MILRYARNAFWDACLGNVLKTTYLDMERTTRRVWFQFRCGSYLHEEERWSNKWYERSSGNKWGQQGKEWIQPKARLWERSSIKRNNVLAHSFTLFFKDPEPNTVSFKYGIQWWKNGLVTAHRQLLSTAMQTSTNINWALNDFAVALKYHINL